MDFIAHQLYTLCELLCSLLSCNPTIQWALLQLPVRALRET